MTDQSVKDKPWHASESEDVAQRLETSVDDGLSGDDAGRRLEEHGRNELQQDEPKGVLAVLVLNATVGFIQERRADQSVHALMQLAAPKATVIRDGSRHELDGAELVPGDIVLLESGARVPADLRIIRTTALRVDESLLTGE